jgi:hypothetical protein
MPEETIPKMSMRYPAGLALAIACGCGKPDSPSDRDPPAPPAPRADQGLRAMPTAEEAAAGWLPLFNGRDLTGWTVVGSGDWQVKDGELVATSGDRGPTASRKRMLGWLASTGEFSNFDFMMEFEFERGWDSGVLFRSRLSLLPWEDGYEIQLLDDVEATKQGLPKLAFPCFPSGTLLGRAKAELGPPDYLVQGRWQKILLEARGPHIRVELNGHAALDVQDGTFASGHLGIQYYTHDLVLRVRRVLVRPMGGGDTPGGTWGAVFVEAAGS